MRVRYRLELEHLLGQRLLRRPILAAVAAVVAMSVVAAACRNDEPDSPAVPIDSVTFVESNFAPAYFSGLKTPGAVITVRLANLRSTALTIDRLDPVADEGLIVDYLGYSGCTSVCPAAEEWTDDAAQVVARARDGRLPVKLRPNDQTTALMFRLRVDEGDVAKFVARCVLRLRGVRVRVAGDKALRTITAPEGKSIGGLQFGSDRRPQGAQGCNTAAEQPRE